MTPSRIEVTTESTWSVQKPPSPTGFWKNVRWCWMYSEGVSSLPAAIFALRQYSRTKNAMEKISIVTTNVAEERRRPPISG